MNDSVESEISLKQLILSIGSWYKFLLTKWKIIVLSGTIFGVLGLAYSIIKKPVYSAFLSFALEDSKSGSLGTYSGIASQFGLDMGTGGGAFSGDNIIELMKSRSMIEKTLLTAVNIKGKYETLANLYIDFNNLRNGWTEKSNLVNVQFLPGADRSKFSLQQDSLLGEFQQNIVLNNLSVDKADKKLSIVLIKVVSKNEIFSKYFTEILADNVSKFYIETKTKKSAQNVNILQHQTDSVRNQLYSAINGAATLADVTPNFNPNRQILRAPAQHKQFEVQANSTILGELEKNLEVSKVSLRNETPLIQIIDRPILPLKKDSISKTKGSAIGFFIGFLIAITLITLKKIYETVMS